MKYLHVELKICEGCGALWLRGGQMDGVYCTECVMHLSSFPAARAKHAGGRPRRPVRVSSCFATHRQPQPGGGE